MEKSLTKVQINKAGGYDVLQLVKAPLPSINKLADDEILVKVHAAGVNYADVCVRWGIYASAKQYVGWPITPGFEFSGIIQGIGRQVKNFNVNDRVLGVTLFGGYTDWIVVKEWQLFHLEPEHNLTLTQAASVPAVFLTAYHALFQNIVTRPGMKILIHSAAGGVGQALVQLSHLLGFEITAVVGCSEKISYVENQLKPHYIIDKSKENLWEKTQQICPQGFDLICDPNGASTLKESYKHLAPMGKLIIYGFHSMLPQKGAS